MLFPRCLSVVGALLGTAVLCPTLASAARVSPEDPRIQCLGRFDHGTAGKAKFAWSGSTIRFQLKSRSATVHLGGAAVRYALLLNGTESAIWQGAKDHSIEVPASLPLPVQVEVVRLNQPLFGDSSFEGVEVAHDSDVMAPAKLPQRWIEFIGDSITAGHGNEAPDKSFPLEAKTENFMKTYGYLTARSLGAQALAEAWSGIRLTPGGGGESMPQRWGRILPSDPGSHWVPSVQPDVVVINLGTNDFSNKAPDESTWKNDYRAFLQTVRKSYPKAWIFCVNGPMLGGAGLTQLKQWTDALVAEMGDAKVTTLYFAGQKMEDGIAGQWHPSMRTHAIMAQRLSAAIAEKTKWTAAPVELPPVTQATH